MKREVTNYVGDASLETGNGWDLNVLHPAQAFENPAAVVNRVI
jgi:hypothetical protein